MSIINCYWNFAHLLSCLGNDISPMKLLVNISCQDTLVDLINVSQVEEICAEILKRERDPEEDISHEKATTGVNLLCNILEILIFGPGIFRKSYCHNNQGIQFGVLCINF